MAALREKIFANVQPHLRPAEQVQGVLSGQTASQYLILAGWVPFVIVNNYRAIVATDQRILLLDAGKWSQTKAESVVAELPRATRLGPPTGTIWHKVQLGNETIRIHRRFHKDVAAIDGAAG